MKHPVEDMISKSVSDLYSIRRRLEKNSPDCRETDLAITKLDEAAMWIKQIPIPLD